MSRLAQRAWYQGDLLHARWPTHQQRVFEAGKLIRRALDRARQPYIAFSGGKDSLAVLYLVHSIRPEVPLHWSDDELEYPDTVALMEAIQQMAEPGQFTITLGWAEHAGWFRPWQDSRPLREKLEGTGEPYFREPLPGAARIQEPIEEWMFRGGFDLVFTGLRKEESQRRRDWLSGSGGLYRTRFGWRCTPLLDWTADDVWALIAASGIAYNAAYDRLAEIGVPRGQQRVGPLPLSPRWMLAEGWPDLLERLEARYGRRWG
jgi:phosphoadenosine phosphosulfate reductase